MSTRDEATHPNLPPKKRHYQHNVTSSASAAPPQTQTYKLTNMSTKQEMRQDSAPRQLVLIDPKHAQRTHDTVVVTTTPGGMPNQSVPGGKVQTVVYTHTGNFAHAGVQYAPNGAFIQTPMNIAPMNMTQGQPYQAMMASDGQVQLNAPMLLSKPPVKQQFMPRSQLVQTGQKVHNMMQSSVTKRNGSHLQLSAIATIKPNTAQSVPTPVYRKITAQQFSRPDVVDHNQDNRQAVFHAKRYAGSKPMENSYEEKEIKEETYDQQDDSMVDLAYQSFDSSDMPHFERGSLIKLENGDCKKVEELSRDDFEKCNSYCPDKRLIKAILIDISSNTSDESLINLTFMVESNPDNKVTVETSKDYPFWSTKFGWSSIEPQLTQQKYRLDCKRLKLNDEILSLEKNNNMPKKADHTATTGTHTDTGPMRPIQQISLNSGSSAFRPIQNNPPSTNESASGGPKTSANLTVFNSFNEKRLISEPTLPASPSKRIRRQSH